MSNRIKLKGTTERSFDLGLANKQTFDASNLTANRTWVLPDSNGTNGYVLSTNGSGNLSWVAQTGGGGTPGGSNTEVQFNDGGSFGGNANFTFNKTTNTLTIGNIASVDSLTFDTANVGGGGVGQFTWNDGDGTLNLGLKGGNVTAQVGEQQYARVYNQEANALVKGEVVYVNGAHGNRVAVRRAQANSEVTSRGTLGFVAETIAAGGEGFVNVSGALYKIDTSGKTAGAPVFLSAATPGAWTTTPPASPNHLVILGWIERVDNTVGSIYVKVDNGYELDELHDVTITTPVADNSVLQYDNANSIWVNRDIAAFRTSANIGNVANINLNGNGSQVLAGNGTWVAQSGGGGATDVLSPFLLMGA